MSWLVVVVDFLFLFLDLVVWLTDPTNQFGYRVIEYSIGFGFGYEILRFRFQLIENMVSVSWNRSDYDPYIM